MTKRIAVIGAGPSGLAQLRAFQSGKQIASYPPRAVLFDYIQGRVAKAGVRDWIRFETAVRWVEKDGDKFNVTVCNLPEDSTYTEAFDHVIVCSGHFSTPNVPYFAGFESFKGRVLHAHDFRDAMEFKDKDILIVGTSYSAEDIGSQCWKYGAKSITVSHRTAAMGYDWPDNWAEGIKAWRMFTSPTCSILACRTSGLRSTCLMRRHGGSAM